MYLFSLLKRLGQCGDVANWIRAAAFSWWDYIYAAHYPNSNIGGGWIGSWETLIQTMPTFLLVFAPLRQSSGGCIGPHALESLTTPKFSCWHQWRHRTRLTRCPGLTGIVPFLRLSGRRPIFKPCGTLGQHLKTRTISVNLGHLVSQAYA